MRAIWRGGFGKQLNQRLFFEWPDAQDLQHRMRRQREVQPLADDGHSHVDADGGPDLGLDRVLRAAEETLDAQMLFDPFERRADTLPTRPYTQRS